MNMSDSGGVLSLPSEHVPGLVALVGLLVLALAGWAALRVGTRRHAGWAEAAQRHIDAMPFAARVAFAGVVVGGVVHAALVPTHWTEDHTIALLFIADAVGFAIAGIWILTLRRHWQTAAVVMLGGTVAVYGWYLLTGREDADVVGLLTTAIELAAALVVLIVHADATSPVRARPHRPVITTAIASVAAVIVTSSLAAAAPTPSGSGTTATGTHASAGAMPGMTGKGAPTRQLALATTSPAGAISWPDDMSTMAPGMKMATPNCNAQPTTAQQQAAVTLVNETVAAAAPYKSLAAAKAAGYRPVTPAGRKIVHYINPLIYIRRPTLNPSEIPVLVYVNTRHGAVLSAAMYLMPPASVASAPPQPGGCLTQWHIHTDLCFSFAAVVGTDEGGGCAAGSFNHVTTPMMHVWLTPVPGGPLAPDPPNAAQVVAANQVPPLSQPNGIA
jgi:hypothetical protein